MDIRQALTLSIFSLTSVNVSSFGVNNPCHPGNHATFPVYLGSRNEHCQSPATGSQPCDMFLTPGWYVTPDAIILTTCPSSGDCGVSYPAWMNDTMPNPNDGIVNRTVCLKAGNDCCSQKLTIQVIKCAGFYVYHLTTLPVCYSVYCFESTLTCDEPTPTTMKTTSASPTLLTTTTTTTATNTISTTESKTVPIYPYYFKDDKDTTVLVGLAIGLVVAVVLLAAAVVVILKHYMANTRVANLAGRILAVEPPPMYEDVMFKGKK